jgi:hypothetical protein
MSTYFGTEGVLQTKVYSPVKNYYYKQQGAAMPAEPSKEEAQEAWK